MQGEPACSAHASPWPHGACPWDTPLGSRAGISLPGNRIHHKGQNYVPCPVSGPWEKPQTSTGESRTPAGSTSRTPVNHLEVTTRACQSTFEFCHRWKTSVWSWLLSEDPFFHCENCWDKESRGLSAPSGGLK
jgi:hypothetical protein